MSNIAVFVLILGGIAYAAYAIPTFYRFIAYCEQIAISVGRTAENASLMTQDDSGLNAFQREQLRFLWSGEYKNHGNAVINAHGQAMAGKIKIAFWGALGMVLSVVVTNYLTT